MCELFSRTIESILSVHSVKYIEVRVIKIK